ncbi:MAG: family 20 glycosylhydrolase [Bacteroidales bacterium]|nr:family 20 glycosylhydrolase [Bacteroidales bacterium]
MKIKFSFLAAFPVLSLMLAVLVSCNPSVTWVEGPTGEDGLAAHSFVFKNIPAGSRVWFQELYDNHQITGGPVAEIKLYQGTSFYLDVPEGAGKSFTIAYAGRPLPRHSWAPEGFVLQVKGKEDQPIPVSYRFLDRKGSDPDPKWFEATYEPTATDIIPAVKLVGQESTCGVHPAGWYRLRIDADGQAAVEADDEDGAFYAKVTQSKLPEGTKDLVIEDWPDLRMRGFMLDVVRDFRSKEDLFKVLDIMASYKLNLLHFHLGDDEAWCLEIPRLPELTSFGAHHETPDWDLKETRGLKPQVCGKIGFDTYYSEADFKEILRYAWDRRIAVVPEFDAPGHSRASIRAMEAYERRTGDDSFRLQNPADTSRYWSAQDFTDNVLDPEYEGVYKFYGVVFDEVIRMYREAGVPLWGIHIGGDEVPDGAWAGRDRREMKDLFTKGILSLAQERGILLAGWQELVQGIYPETLEALKKQLLFVNAWSTEGDNIELTYTLANEGVPVLLSNVQNAYVDLAYDDDPESLGLTWGGYVDERKSFALQPWKIYESVRWEDIDTPFDWKANAVGRPELKHPENIVGAEALLWSENNRSIDDVTFQMLPKAVGIWERGWNSTPDWPTDEAFAADFNRFYSILVKKEMPAWSQAGYRYKKR